jgi:hypothetical protein
VGDRPYRTERTTVFDHIEDRDEKGCFGQAFSEIHEDVGFATAGGILEATGLEPVVISDRP